MDLRHKPPGFAGFQDAGGLFGSEEAFVAEHVHIFSKGNIPALVFRPDGRDHLAADQVDIVPLAAEIGPAHGMGPEERGPDDGG